MKQQNILVAVAESSPEQQSSEGGEEEHREDRRARVRLGHADAAPAPTAAANPVPQALLPQISGRPPMPLQEGLILHAEE